MDTGRTSVIIQTSFLRNHLDTITETLSSWHPQNQEEGHSSYSSALAKEVPGFESFP